MNEIEKFFSEVKENIRKMGDNISIHNLSNFWIKETSPFNYTYNFTWMGRPIIQYPQDTMAMQEIIWRIKPQLIVETGIAHGGSLVFYASMLELLGGDGVILGIDIDIRQHNRFEIERHSMAKRIKMLEGSSVDEAIVIQVREFARGKSPILVILDSMHTREHVLGELYAYSSLVTRGSYLVVFDTIIEDMPDDMFPNRPWGRANNPKTAVRDFMMVNDRFEIDREIENKLLITDAPQGYLRCIKD